MLVPYSRRSLNRYSLLTDLKATEFVFCLLSYSRSAVGERKLKTDRKVIFLYTLGAVAKICIYSIVLRDSVYDGCLESNFHLF
jgi:hypothetical protein